MGGGTIAGQQGTLAVTTVVDNYDNYGILPARSSLHSASDDRDSRRKRLVLPAKQNSTANLRRTIHGHGAGARVPDMALQVVEDDAAIALGRSTYDCWFWCARSRGVPHR